MMTIHPNNIQSDNLSGIANLAPPRDLMRQKQRKLEELHADTLFIVQRYDGVESLGIGAKYKNGNLTYELCYRVYVRKKLPLDKLDHAQLIPASIFGIPTDVVEADSYNTYLDTTKHRPVKGGILMKNKCHENATMRGAATLGCIAVTADTNKKVALTCLHAVADGRSLSDTGYDVGQPYRTTCCCCCHKNVIGEMLRADPSTDSAIVELNDETADALNTQALENTIQGVGEITGIQQAVCFDEVEKCGAGSGHTIGVIIDIRYQGDKILVSPGTEAFAAPGDSGAVIVHKPTKKVVGLLIGGLTGAESIGVGYHIGPVMTALNIRIAGWAVGAVGIPSGSCGVVIPTVLTNAQNWLDKYDNTSLPDLVSLNTTDFASDAERQARRDAVNNVLERILVPRWNARKAAALSDTAMDRPELPYHAVPATSTEIEQNRRFDDLEHLALYQENLYKAFFSDGSGGINYVKLREAFELFANGNARLYPKPATADAPFRDPGYREPDGGFMLMFAEFSFVCLENAHNTNKPVNNIHEDVWLNVARITVGMQELFMHVYGTSVEAAPPEVRPVGNGQYRGNSGELRDYRDYNPGNFNRRNNTSGTDAYLTASSSISQSDNLRKAKVRHKYLGLSFSELKLAMKENIQQMLRMT